MLCYTGQIFQHFRSEFPFFVFVFWHCLLTWTPLRLQITLLKIMCIICVRLFSTLKCVGLGSIFQIVSLGRLNLIFMQLHFLTHSATVISCSGHHTLLLAEDKLGRFPTRELLQLPYTTLCQLLHHQPETQYSLPPSKRTVKAVLLIYSRSDTLVCLVMDAPVYQSS